MTNTPRFADSGFLQGTALGSLTTAYSYNSFGELKTDSTTYSSNAYLSHEYTYDKVGRILSRTETILGNRDQYAYTYDSAGRLTDVNKNNAPISHYDYDLNGNRLSRSALGVSETATYDDQDRMLTYGDLSYSYTANGELKSTTNTKTGQVTQYSYDVLGNVLKVVLPDGKVIEYVVDGQDRRIAKKVNGEVVSGFLYEGDLSPVAELDNQNRIVSRFVYGTKLNVPDYIEKGGKTYRVVTDHLGSVRLVVDVSDGTIAQKMEYDEFGRVLSDSSPGFQPFGFAGGLYEAQTGLVRFGARDYDATTGRWTTKDPIGFGGGDTNLYGYVVNDPINFLDTLGLWKYNFSGGGHLFIPISVLPISGGGTYNTEYLPNGKYHGSEYTPEIVIGEYADIGVSAGFSDITGCHGKKAGNTISVSFPFMGKYGGAQITTRNDFSILHPTTWIPDGIQVGFGIGANFPITYTYNLKAIFDKLEGK